MTINLPGVEVMAQPTPLQSFQSIAPPCEGAPHTAQPTGRILPLPHDPPPRPHASPPRSRWRAPFMEMSMLFHSAMGHKEIILRVGQLQSFVEEVAAGSDILEAILCYYTLCPPPNGQAPTLPYLSSPTARGEILFTV